ncbi:type I DNA topoisomerase [bacterium]|nr:type I DNA topoisomerase [bacterium]
MADKPSYRPRGKNLLIVESPAKIKTISKFLGPDFQVTSTFGHTTDLPTKTLGVQVDNENKTVVLEYVPIQGKQKVITDICKQASHAQEIYLASDPDREGEVISWHIAKEIEKISGDDKKIYRITFNEITRPAITEAIQNKGKIDKHKVNAQQARRVLDRWVGYEVSPILWKKITKGLSAGRVQSVALLLVCNREEEIVSFKPEESWSIHALFKTEDGTLDSELYKIKNKKADIKDKETADTALEAVKKESYVVDSLTERERLKRAMPPFMTSTLQQDAHNKLGFSVSKTMTLAQQLYEGIPLQDKNKPEALITYMRTDSLRISDTALKESREFLKEKLGKDYVPSAANTYSKKGAQDAHEAIRPVKVTISPEVVDIYADRDVAKLYKLIWRRFLASQMTPAKYFQRQVLVSGGDFIFKATGSTLVFDGFLKVYAPSDDKEDAKDTIPKSIAKDKALDLGKTDSKQHFTQPPPRYSEASLVKDLESKGIGRPSTYAATISTIQKRSYIEIDKKRFSPTELGRTVSSLLVKHFPDIINVQFTAKMEEYLDKIAAGEVDRDKVLLGFYEKFSKDLEAFGGMAKGKAAVKTDIKCPECGKELLVRFGKSGEFLGCSGFPDCKVTKNFERDEKGEIQIVDQVAGGEVESSEELGNCPQCNKELVKRMGRFGPFTACSGYPECKYIPQEKLGHPCPSCGKDIIKRKWQKGSFWGCSGYPKCRFTIFGDVIDQACPECKNGFMVSAYNGANGPSCPKCNPPQPTAKKTTRKKAAPKK